MKKIIELICLLFIGLISKAQVPQGFNFQGIAIDSAGYVVASKPITLRFSISSDSLGNSINYQEVVNSQTDKYGQFTVVIGSGKAYIGDFAAIPWQVGNLFMKTEIDIANTGKYVVTGLSKMLSVPYALYAGRTDTITISNRINTKLNIYDTTLMLNTRIGRDTASLSNRINTKLNITDAAAYGTGSVTEVLVKTANGVSGVVANPTTVPAITLTLGNITPTSISSSGAITGTTLAGTLVTAAQPNITLVGTLKQLTVTNSVTAGTLAKLGGTSLQYLMADGSTTTSTSSGVPYSGATGPVNLGAYDLKVNNITVGLGGGNVGTNTAIGNNVLNKNTSGYSNSAIGSQALQNNISGNNNTAIGYFTLANNTTGNSNIAIGSAALNSNTTGGVNNAIGLNALKSNTTASENNAFGHQSLEMNTIGTGNAAFGHNALQQNVVGSNNTAMGYAALNSNLAEGNTTIGWRSLQFNTTGSNNASFGEESLTANTTGSNLTAIGARALQSNKTGNNLIAIGYASDISVDGLSNSIIIGYDTKVSSSNTTSIGNSTTTKWVFGIPTTTNAGYAFQVGSTSSNGNGAYLTNGGTWTNASSREYKNNFTNIDGEVILDKIDKLSIQKWNYLGTSETHIGPIAEEFKEQFDLGVTDDDKHISTIDGTGIALKAIQELNKKLKNKDEKIKELDNRLKELELLLQKLLNANK